MSNREERLGVGLKVHVRYPTRDALDNYFPENLSEYGKYERRWNRTSQLLTC